MTNTETIWHIIDITGGRVLDAHDLLTSNGVPCLAFVEIGPDKKAQSKRKRGKVPLVATSAFSTYLFADLSAVESQMALVYLSGRKSYLGAAWGKRDAPQGKDAPDDAWLCAIKDSEFNGTRSIAHETGRRKGKPIYETYDRKKHSRFNLNKLRGQGEVVPDYTEGDRVEFCQGGMRGLIYEVGPARDDGHIDLIGEAAFFGGVNMVRVTNPYMLQKVA